MTELRGILIGVAPLLASTAIMVVGHSLFGTLLSVRLDLEGVPVAEIGTILALFSVGFIAGTLAGPPLLVRVGHVRTFAAFAAIASTTALVHAFAVDTILWAALRIIAGFSLACLFTTIESWLNGAASNALRGQVMSAYMMTYYLAAALAQMLIGTMDPGGFALFSLVAILLALSIVPLALFPSAAPTRAATERLGIAALVRISPLGVAGCVAAGVVVGAFLSLGPVYARALDPSPARIGLFMMVATLAGFLLQFPMGRLSDRFDRRRVFLGVLIASAVLALLTALLGAISPWLTLPLVALLGGTIYTYYPLALSHANDRMTQGQMVPAAAGLLLTYGAGAIVGPILASAMMAWLGRAGLFHFIALVGAVMALFALWRMSQRAPKPNLEQGAFVAVPTTTPAVSGLDPRSQAAPPATMAAG